MDQGTIRDAATVILVRDPATEPKVLMGQRGEGAAFMPGKFVFPGGAVDSQDRSIPFTCDLPEPCTARLEEGCAPGLGAQLFAAAIRELWEETGLMIGADGEWPGKAPQAWSEFAGTGLVPDPRALSFMFRAITPPGRPRRFDARFFLGNADVVRGDPDDFSGASDELLHLQWIALGDLGRFEMPVITEVVLAEVIASLPGLGPPDSVPFLQNGSARDQFPRPAATRSRAARKLRQT